MRDVNEGMGFRYTFVPLASGGFVYRSIGLWPKWERASYSIGLSAFYVIVMAYYLGIRG